MSIMDSIQASYQSLLDSEQAIEEEFAALSEDQLSRRPSENAWSLLEIAEHLLLAQEATLASVKSNLDNLSQAKQSGILSAYTLKFMGLVFGGRLRFKVPVKTVLPKGEASYAEITERWNALHTEWPQLLARLNEDTALTRVFRHPVFGWYNISQTLSFLKLHTEHHRRQVERTMAALGLQAIHHTSK